MRVKENEEIKWGNDTWMWSGDTAKKEKGSSWGIKENEHTHIETSNKGHRKNEKKIHKGLKRIKTQNYRIIRLRENRPVIDFYEHRRDIRKCDSIVLEGKNHGK